MLDLEGKPMRVVLTMTNHADGTSTATLAIDSGAVEIPVSKITQQGGNVALEVKVVSGSYAATLSADGSELAGRWTEKAFSASLAFRRARR